ncbi:MAG: head GIN domain-containing protein [Dysgonamonadaceae bacterium]
MNPKKLILLSTLIISTIMISQTACGQQRITTKNFQVREFNSIKSDMIGNIIITQSNSSSVRAEGSEDLINALTIEVSNGELKLSMKSSIRKRFKNTNSKLTVWVNSPQINRVKNEGVGNITLKGKIDSDELIIESNGVGNFKAEDLNVGNARVNSEGVGNVMLSGSAVFLELNSDGVGNVDTKNLKAKDVIVHSDGVGSVKCYASRDIELYASGIGSVIYYGNPNIKALHKDGIGSLKSGD